MTTYVITTAPLGARIGDAVAYGGSVSDSELADNHYRRVDGDRLLWSGRLTTQQRDPGQYAAALVADIKKTYPQLGDVVSEYAWSGTLGHTVHGMPQIGQLSPGFTRSSKPHHPGQALARLATRQKRIAIHHKPKSVPQGKCSADREGCFPKCFGCKTFFLT